MGHLYPSTSDPHRDVARSHGGRAVSHATLRSASPLLVPEEPLSMERRVDKIRIVSLCVVWIAWAACSDSTPEEADHGPGSSVSPTVGATHEATGAGAEPISPTPGDSAQWDSSSQGAREWDAAPPRSREDDMGGGDAGPVDASGHSQDSTSDAPGRSVPEACMRCTSQELCAERDGIFVCLPRRTGCSSQSPCECVPAEELCASCSSAGGYIRCSCPFC